MGKGWESEKEARDQVEKKDHEKILEEIIIENFPKMGKEIINQVQETQRVPNRINPRRNTPRHIQRMRWLDSITNSMDMNLRKL